MFFTEEDAVAPAFTDGEDIYLRPDAVKKLLKSRGFVVGHELAHLIGCIDALEDPQQKETLCDLVATALFGKEQSIKALNRLERTERSAAHMKLSNEELNPNKTPYFNYHSRTRQLTINLDSLRQDSVYFTGETAFDFLYQTYSS